MACHSLSLLSITPSASQSCSCGSKKSNNLLLISLPLSTLFGIRVHASICPSNSSRFAVKHRQCTLATAYGSFQSSYWVSLKPEKAFSEKLTKWSARAIKSFAMAELEAKKLKYPQTGTGALLMGILVEVHEEKRCFAKSVMPLHIYTIITGCIYHSRL